MRPELAGSYDAAKTVADELKGALDAQEAAINAWNEDRGNLELMAAAARATDRVRPLIARAEEWVSADAS